MMRLKQQSKVKTQVPVQPLEDAFNMNSKEQQNEYHCMKYEISSARKNVLTYIFKILIIPIIGRVKFLIKTMLLWAISSKHVPLPQLHSVIFR